MKKRILFLCAVMVVGLLMTSCATQRPVTMASGSVLQLNMDKDSYTILGTGTGQACASYFLGIPVGGENTYKLAVEQAIAERGGNMIIQSSVDRIQTYFPSTFFAISNKLCTSVTGTVIKLKI